MAQKLHFRILEFPLTMDCSSLHWSSFRRGPGCVISPLHPAWPKPTFRTLTVTMWEWSLADAIGRLDGKSPWGWGLVPHHIVKIRKITILIWLVVWLPSILFSHILGIIIPIDELIFFRGVAQPPTSVIVMNRYHWGIPEAFLFVKIVHDFMNQHYLSTMWIHKGELIFLCFSIISEVYRIYNQLHIGDGLFMFILVKDPLVRMKSHIEPNQCVWIDGCCLAPLVTNDFHELHQFGAPFKCPRLSTCTVKRRIGLQQKLRGPDVVFRPICCQIANYYMQWYTCAVFKIPLPFHFTGWLENGIPLLEFYKPPYIASIIPNHQPSFIDNIPTISPDFDV